MSTETLSPPTPAEHQAPAARRAHAETDEERDARQALAERLRNSVLVGLIEIGSVAEVADAIGCPRSNVTTWYGRRASTGFPEALFMAASGKQYDVRECVLWHAQWVMTGKGRS